MPSEAKPAVVVRAAEIEQRATAFVHPWNPTSEIRAAFLGRAAGLRRTGVNLLRVPPGQSSFTYHAHLHEEEWLYVLAGRAIVDSGDVAHEVGAGDLIVFPTPSAPHQLRNVFAEDVVYLTGGEHAELDVVDFPRLGTRVVRIGDRATVYQLDDGAALPFPGIDRL